MLIRPRSRFLLSLIFLAACSSDDGVAVTGPAPAGGGTHLERVDAIGTVAQPIDGWMGSAITEFVRVRVVDSGGAPVQGARVLFSVAADGGRLLRDGVATNDTALFALSDAYGVVTTSGWAFPQRDTVNTRHVLFARLDNGGDAGLSFVARAWRDVTRFGGTAPAVLDLPVDRQRLSAILPLGVLGRDEALPSSDALLVPKNGQSSSVRAMADGIITDVEESNGAVTMRVRDHVLVRLAGMTLRSSMWVGRVMRAGDTLGLLDAKAGSMLAVRVLDAAVQRTQWVNASRYGARQNTAFFAQYLPDNAGARSATYAMIRRSAPDLEGRIDYDRNGRLVGTWFDPSSPAVSSKELTTMSPFSARRPSELDPSNALGLVGLTFAYDAERPGQVRIAAGTGLSVRLGLRGVRAVAWEDLDPAEVGQQSGIVRYHLFADDDRVGEATQVLLVQLVDANTLRAELVPGRGAESAVFSSRASILIR